MVTGGSVTGAIGSSAGAIKSSAGATGATAGSVTVAGAGACDASCNNLDPDGGAPQLAKLAAAAYAYARACATA